MPLQPTQASPRGVSGHPGQNQEYLLQGTLHKEDGVLTKRFYPTQYLMTSGIPLHSIDSRSEV